MNSNHFDSVKLGKKNAIPNYRIANLFRVIEICVIFIVISKVSSQLPLALKSSSEYLKDFTIVFASPRFGFVIGNVIVITLLMKSGYFSTKDSSKNDRKFDIYEEFVEKSKRIIKDDIEKKSVCEQKMVMVDKYTTITNNALEKKIYKTKPDTYNKKGRSKLRRPITDSCPRNDVDDGLKLGRLRHSSYTKDNLTNEEFKSAVEAFIARQQRFLRQEEDDYSPFLMD